MNEKILCLELLKEIQQRLNATTLIISIPRRTCMTIVDYDANDELLAEFKKLHYYTYNDDNYGNAQITDGFFIVKEGEIVEFKIKLDADSLSDLQITEEGNIIDEYETARQLYQYRKS